jgi:enterochelin esterase-like enzyme
LTDAARFRTFEQSDPELTEAGFSFVTVASEALGHRADISFYAAPGVEAAQDVPVVMLLHGVYGSHWAWAFKGAAHRTAARLVAAGELPPVLLAMPSDGLWRDGSGYVSHGIQDFECWIVEEVPAAARLAYPVCSERSPLLIAGLSMGGFAALRLAGKYPERFRAAAGHSSITQAGQLDPMIPEGSRDGWSAAPGDISVLDALSGASAPLPPLRFDCGLDDPLLDANRSLHEALEARRIVHDYAEHPGGHEWPYWRKHLEDTLRFFGRALG